MTHAGDRPRLCDAALAGLPAAVRRPAYVRSTTQVGIVHLGAGAFHRAHQAVYIDDLLAADPRWAVCAVSLHSTAVRDALRPQDGLYTLAVLGPRPQLRVVGALREVLCARDQAAAVGRWLSDPAVHLVTLTITEKGYCLAGDELDFEHPEIRTDLARPDAPTGAIGHLVAALQARRDAGRAPFNVLSCDNLADNGRRLRRAVLQYAQRLDPSLARWIESEVAFPRSMVDSITPATDDVLRERVVADLGCHDAWPVQREDYAQWVIEDEFRGERPDLRSVGAILSSDIAGHDRAKLRLLNAPHSSLAYLGSLMQIETVADAMRTPALAAFVERLMRLDIAPTLNAPRGFDVRAYIDAILARFRNDAVQHRLAQIAWDGSQKLPVRLLGTIGDALAAGRPIDRLCLPVAAWMRFVRRQARLGVTLVDPLEQRLTRIGLATSGEAQADVDAFLRLEAVFSTLASERKFVEALRRGYAQLADATPAGVAHALSSSVED